MCFEKYSQEYFHWPHVCIMRDFLFLMNMIVSLHNGKSEGRRSDGTESWVSEGIRPEGWDLMIWDQRRRRFDGMRRIRWYKYIQKTGSFGGAWVILWIIPHGLLWEDSLFSYLFSAAIELIITVICLNMCVSHPLFICTRHYIRSVGRGCQIHYSHPSQLHRPDTGEWCRPTHSDESQHQTNINPNLSFSYVGYHLVLCLRINVYPTPLD